MLKLLKKLTLVVSITLSFTVILASSAFAGIESDIQNALICPACFDDGMTVAACQDSTAQQIKEDITKQLASGKTKDQILQSYIQQYGEKILTEPPKEGFNLMAYITPFAGIALGGVLIYFALSQWVRKPNKSKKVNKESTVVDEYYQAKVEEEFKKYL